METFALLRVALTAGAAVSLLTACGASQPQGVWAPTSAAAQAGSHRQTFKYTGGKQSFKVPAGVTQITVTAIGGGGAAGGDIFSGDTSSGGKGGSVTATIPVKPGERLGIFVGGSGRHGGFNGGGASGPSCSKACFNFGGGASDVRQRGDELGDRVVVAAGGGGGGANGNGYSTSGSFSIPGGDGGIGGGRRGASGRRGDSGAISGSGGSGGTRRAGGSGGSGGENGSDCGGADGTQGSGGVGGPSSGCGGTGGGGGGGYYGGGGGGAGASMSASGSGGGGGGGGGSSFVEKLASNVKAANDANRFDGSIVIVW
jgi:hypothetical protein